MNIARKPVSFTRGAPESHFLSHGSRRRGSLPGQMRMRLLPGAYTLRFECVGHNPLSRVKKTGQPGYNLAMDAISLRRLPWDHMEQWLADYLAKESPSRGTPSLLDRLCGQPGRHRATACGLNTSFFAGGHLIR